MIHLSIHEVERGIHVVYPDDFNPGNQLKGRILYRVRDHSSVFMNDIITCKDEDYNELKKYSFRDLLSSSTTGGVKKYSLHDVGECFFGDIPNSVLKSTLERL